MSDENGKSKGVPHGSLSVPHDWWMTAAEKAEFYGHLGVAQILESNPDDECVEAFHNWLAERDDAPVATTWGIPDFGAARTMLGMSIDEAAAAIGISVLDYEIIESGVVSPPLHVVVDIARYWGIPIAALFRNEKKELHRRTFLGEVAGLPTIEMSHE